MNTKTNTNSLYVAKVKDIAEPDQKFYFEIGTFTHLEKVEHNDVFFYVGESHWNNTLSHNYYTVLTRYGLREVSKKFIERL